MIFLLLSHFQMYRLKKTMKIQTLAWITVVLLAGLFLSQPAIAQTLEPSKIDLSKLGPQVGEIVPDFSLLDQDGQTWTREAIMGPKGAMLVFVRSAGW